MLYSTACSCDTSFACTYCFFSTDVSPSSSVHVNIKVISTAASIPTNQTFFVCFIDSHLHVGSFIVKFSSDVNVRCERDKFCFIIEFKLFYVIVKFQKISIPTTEGISYTCRTPTPTHSGQDTRRGMVPIYLAFPRCTFF